MSETPCKLESDLFCGGCCVNVRVALYADEVTNLVEGGTKLITILRAHKQLKPEGVDEETELLSWTDEEAQEYLQQRLADAEPRYKNTWLKIIDVSRTLLPGQGLYVIDGRCGYLQEDGSCGNYDNRPEVCRNFEPESEGCLRLRSRPDIPVPVAMGRLSSQTQVVRGC